MKIVIAPDSFKECLTADEVAKAIQSGFVRIFPEASYSLCPMADGGEGTVQSLVKNLNGKIIYTQVKDPIGNQCSSFFGISGDHKIAFIEMAAASGLELLPQKMRNPLFTTTYGVGELIQQALEYQVEKIIIGLGGSATNDAGAGMLQALGGKLLDKNGHSLSYGGAALAQLDSIDLSTLDPRLEQVSFEVACDVTNTLYGELGASVIFAPQKGANKSMVAELDTALQHFSNIVQQQLNKNIGSIPGSGAAGGLGAAMLLMPHVKMKPGIDIIIENSHLSEKLRDADLVITGEGQMDSQSIYGKTPIGVAQCAKQFNKPVIAIVGSLKEDYPLIYQYGIDAVFPTIQQVESLDLVLQNAERNISSCAENIARLFKLATNS